MFQKLLDWILNNCVITTFSFSNHNYTVGVEFSHDILILAVNFCFWVILGFFFCFFIKLSRWCIRKCLRK